MDSITAPIDNGVERIVDHGQGQPDGHDQRQRNGRRRGRQFGSRTTRPRISGGYDETGSITFTLTAPNGTHHTVGTVPVSGNGTYTAPTVTATQVGTYVWHASYSGDGLNNGAIDNGANESLTTVKASPTVATSASETAGGVVGTSVLSDSATLSGGYDETGSITFTLTAPNGTTTTVGTVSVSGNGTYTAPTVTATQVGTYVLARQLQRRRPQ